MLSQINIDMVKQDAEENYRRGFTCSESVVAAVRDNVDPDMPLAILSVASGFGSGVGRSKCMCGSVAGGVIALGYFFGRGAEGGSSRKCLDAANELQSSFRENHKGVLCCHVQTRGMDMSSCERINQCVSFTGEMASTTAKIIAREFDIPLTNN